MRYATTRAVSLLVAQTLLSALLLAQTGVSVPQNQNPDLDRIRADIVKLRGRLEEVRSKTKTAEQELEEVSIELDIRTREVEIAMRVEADSSNTGNAAGSDA